MKKTFLLILCFSVITGARSSLASMIQLYEFSGSYNANLYNIDSYEFYTGDYNRVGIASIDKENFNTTVKIDTWNTQNLIAMFQRTYIPRPPIEQDEFTYMFLNNVLYGSIEFRETPPSDAGWNGSYYFNSITDLSAYHIDALYLSNSFSTDGASGVYDIKLLADATPIVPEPSTILLLGVGLSLLVFIRRRSRYVPYPH